MGLFSGDRWQEDTGPWWSTKCASDSRFNMGGAASSVTGAYAAADAAIRKRGEELGIEPPDDIEVTGGKA